MACKEPVPWTILRPSVRRVTETLVPHDLARLNQHRENIVALHKEKNWQKLNSEQVNTYRIVQVGLRELLLLPRQC